MADSTLFVGSSSVVVARGVRDRHGSFINDATVTMETWVNKETGNAVQGVTLPMQLTYVAGTDGVYEAPIPHNVGITVGNTYTATFKVVKGELQAVWSETIRAAERKA